MSARVGGYIGLTIGQRVVTIAPSSFLLPSFAFGTLYVENKIDAPPVLDIEATPGRQTLNADGSVISVEIELNQAPDTGNYVLQWGIA